MYKHQTIFSYLFLCSHTSMIIIGLSIVLLLKKLTSSSSTFSENKINSDFLAKLSSNKPVCFTDLKQFCWNKRVAWINLSCLSDKLS